MLNGFIPLSEDTLTIVQATGSVAGALANVAAGQRLKSSDGVGSFVVDYGVSSPFNSRFVVLSEYLPVLPGDYNFNGIVDAADYTVWRDTLGQTGVALPADGNNDGQVDLDDWEFWKTHFGETAGSGSAGASPSQTAVPEPPSSLIIGLAAIAILCCRSIDSRHSFCVPQADRG